MTRRRVKRGLILPDAHFPFHDKEACEVVVEVCDREDPDFVVTLGDNTDCTLFSRHGKKAVSELTAHSYLTDEIDPLNKWLDRLQKVRRYERKSKKPRDLYYLSGNHEQWFERWSMEATPHLSLVDDLYKKLSPRALISEGRERFKWVPYYDTEEHFQKLALLDSLWLTHGWSHAANAARAHQVKGGRLVGVVHGHTHRSQWEATVNPVTKQPLLTGSPGCLASRKRLYKHDKGPDQWVHGYATVQLDETSGFWSVTPHLILPGGKVLLQGKVVSA